MDIVTWFLLSLAYVVGLIWSLIWFPISGWVSTLLQIAVFIASQVDILMLPRATSISPDG